jgi:hypothetical protein
MSKKRPNLWRLWCYALGQKQGKNNTEADTVAIIRTAIVSAYMITNVAIVANALRHWNNVPNDTNSQCVCVKKG